MRRRRTTTIATSPAFEVGVSEAIVAGGAVVEAITLAGGSGVAVTRIGSVLVWWAIGEAVEVGVKKHCLDHGQGLQDAQHAKLAYNGIQSYIVSQAGVPNENIITVDY